MEDDFMPTIKQAKELIVDKKYKECEALICTSMFEHPHDAIPHISARRAEHGNI